MDNALIQYVQIAFDPVHGYIPAEYSCFDIPANEFCKTLMSIPGYGEVPNGQLNIKGFTA